MAFYKQVATELEPSKALWHFQLFYDRVHQDLQVESVAFSQSPRRIGYDRVLVKELNKEGYSMLCRAETLGDPPSESDSRAIVQEGVGDREEVPEV